MLAPGLEVVSEPRAGVSRGRNAGIRAARGEFIAMTDDDCLPEPDFLDAVLNAFADPAIGYYGGRVLLHDPADYPITIKTSMQREEFPSGTVLPPGALHGANFGFRRAVLERIGGFDTNMGPGTRSRSGEDLELATRASFGGWRGVYDPAADGATRPWSAHARFRSFTGPQLRHRTWRLLPACRAPRWCRNAGAQTLVLEHVVQALPRHPALLSRGARRRLLARCVRPTPRARAALSSRS